MTDDPPLDDGGLADRLHALERSMRTPDLQQRRAAANELWELCRDVRVGAHAAIPTLVECLGDADEEVGDSASWALCHCAPLSLDPLIACLAGPDPAARRRACSALGNIGDDARPASPALRTLLADPLPAVRERAAWALGLVHDTSAATIDALLAMARSVRTGDRRAALHALGNLGQALDDPRPLQDGAASIVASLDDADADVRWSACYALEALDLDPDAHVALLVRVVEHESSAWIRQAIARQLQERVASANLEPSLRVVAATLRRGASDASEWCDLAAKLGPKARELVPALVDALGFEGSTPIAAARALWAVDRRASESLPVLARLFDEGYEESVCDAICELGPAAAALAPRVVEAMRSDDWDLQWAAADALGALSTSTDDVLAALEGALGHDSPLVKGAAVRALAAMGAKALPGLVTLLADRSDARAEWAADALGRMGSAASVAADALRAALDDARPRVAEWAAIALAHVAGDPAGLPILVDRLVGAEHADLRRASASAIAALGPTAREAAPALESLLDDGDPEVRFAAAEALAAIRAKAN